MATFDQLSAEERAIIELVVQRGRSYDALADVLQIEPTRVREMAREALIQLSPRTAARVDDQWRSQVADYVLGQQSGPESTATRGHLKRSEPARMWALSLLDSLDTLYADSARPEIPDPDGAAPERGRRRGGDDAATAERPRERERARRPLRAAEEVKKPPEEEDKDKDKKAADKAAARSELSPAAQAALRRRRVLGVILATVVGAGVVVAILAIAGVFSGSSKKKSASASKPAAQQQPKIVGQIPLTPVGGAKATGTAFILQRGSQRVLVVQAKLPPLPSNQRKAAYEVWLFNSPKDAQTIGAQFTDAQGNYQGAGALPANFTRFRFVDISREPFDTNTAHSGNSVLRGAFASLQPVQQPSGGGGTSTTPGGTTTGP